MKNIFKLVPLTLVASWLLSACSPNYKMKHDSSISAGIQGLDLNTEVANNDQLSDDFRYVRSLKACVNPAGAVGRNTHGKLECADFADVDWAKRNLKGQSLRNAKVSGVSFFQADLSEVDFSGADLRGSSFFKANLTGTIFDEDTKLSEDLSKDQVLKRGGIFKDYKKLDQEFVEAVLNGQFEFASKLLAQMAGLNDSIFDGNRILNGPTKSILQYLVKNNIEIVFEGSNGHKILSLFDAYHVQAVDKLSKLLDVKNEIGIVLERGIMSGMNPQDIWQKAAQSFADHSKFVDIEKQHPEYLDIFLQLKEIKVNQPTDVGADSCQSIIIHAKSVKAMEYIISKGYDVGSNPCFKFDLERLAENSDLETTRYLRTKGYNFLMVEDGHSRFFDTLVLRDQGLFSYEKFKYIHERAFSLLTELGMEKEEFLNKIPVSVDSMIKKVAELVVERSFDQQYLSQMAKIIQTFRLNQRLNSQGENLIEMTSPDRLLRNQRLKETIEFYLQLGIPLRAGQKSIFGKVLRQTFSPKDIQVLENLIEIFKKENVALSGGDEKQNPIFYARNLNVVRVLVKNGFSLNLLDSEGRSLYWYLSDYESHRYLQDNHVPFDIKEVVKGELLIDVLCKREGMIPGSCSYSTAESMVEGLMRMKLVSLLDLTTVQFFKNYILKNDNNLSLYLLDLLIRHGIIKKIKFAQCELNGQSLFIEDPKMSLFQALRPRTYHDSKWPSSDNSLIVILKKNLVTNWGTKIQELSGKWGLSILLSQGEYSDTLEVETQDLESISLNGKKCSFPEKYPEDLKTHFRFLYLLSDDDRQLYINLKDITQGGFIWEKNKSSQELARVTLAPAQEKIETIWPDLKNYIMWEAIGLSEGRLSRKGFVALPKSVLSKPVIGDRFTIHTYDWNDKVKGIDFLTVRGTSY